MCTNNFETDFLQDRRQLVDALVPVLKAQLENREVRGSKLTGTSFVRSSPGASQSAPAEEVLRFSASFTSVDGASHEVRMEISRSEGGRPQVTLNADQNGPRMEYTVRGDIAEIIPVLQSSIVGLFDSLCSRGPAGPTRL